MKRKGWFSNGLALLACLGMLFSGPMLQAASPQAGPSRVAAVPDVALDAGGTLHGQVVDAQGNPVGKTAVAVRHGRREVARAVSDESGRFRLGGLHGGLYEIAVGQRATVCRLWVPNTAPPSAKPAALVVLGDEQVLGQCSPQTCNRLKCWLANPLVIAGIVAVAVGIPVAIHNCKGREPKSPS